MWKRWYHELRATLGQASGLPRPGSLDLERLRAVARTLPNEELGGTTDPLSLDDVLADLAPHPQEDRLLGFYTEAGLDLALRAYGVRAAIAEAGYPEVFGSFEPDHATGQRVRLFGDEAHTELLVELVVRMSQEIPPLRLLSVEWLLLQNPRLLPAPERPLLPGQEHPGLGCFNCIVGMLVMAVERLGLDGMLFSPAHYHMAVRAYDQLRFLEPTVEARFLAMVRLLEHVPFEQASWAVARGHVVDAQTGAPVAWRAEPMILPQSRAARRLVRGPEYELAVRGHLSRQDLRVVSDETATAG